MSNKNIRSATAGSDLQLDDSIQLWILHLREALVNTSNEGDQNLEGSGNHIIKNNLKHLQGRKKWSQARKVLWQQELRLTLRVSSEWNKYQWKEITNRQCWVHLEKDIRKNYCCPTKLPLKIVNRINICQRPYLCSGEKVGLNNLIIFWHSIFHAIIFLYIFTCKGGSSWIKELAHVLHLQHVKSLKANTRLGEIFARLILF